MFKHVLTMSKPANKENNKWEDQRKKKKRYNTLLC